MNCNICPRMCNVDRNNKKGFCQMPNEILVAKTMLHKWEEPCISGENGSGAVFFSGCSLRCVYCQNEKISRGTVGKVFTKDELYAEFVNLIEQGAHNINLVTPTHYARQIYEVLSEKPKLPVPIVYNTSGYESVETLKMLEGMVDVYLTDIKYYDSDISKKYSMADDYFSVATKAVEEMLRQVGVSRFDDNGMLERGVIIRHLVLPNYIDQSKKIINWMNDNLLTNILLSIMCQYIPCGDTVKYPEINRKLAKAEYDEVLNYLYETDLTEGYVQDMDSASEDYIPDF